MPETDAALLAQANASAGEMSLIVVIGGLALAALFTIARYWPRKVTRKIVDEEFKADTDARANRQMAAAVGYRRRMS